MKSYKQENNKILFRTDERSNDDRIYDRIIKVCLDISKKCENKDESEFPIHLLKELINLNNKLVGGTENKRIDRKYIEYISTNKESIGYFLDKSNEEKEVSNSYERKRLLYNKFKDDISKFY